MTAKDAWDILKEWGGWISGLPSPFREIGIVVSMVGIYWLCRRPIFILKGKIELRIQDIKGDRASMRKEQRFLALRWTVTRWQEGPFWFDGSLGTVTAELKDAKSKFSIEPGIGSGKVLNHEFDRALSFLGRYTRVVEVECLGSYTGRYEKFITNMVHPCFFFSIVIYFPPKRCPKWVRGIVTVPPVDLGDRQLEIKAIRNGADAEPYVCWDIFFPIRGRKYTIEWEW